MILNMWWVSGFLCVLLTCRLSEQVQEMIWFVFFYKGPPSLSPGFPGGSVVKKKKLASDTGDPGSIPGWGRSPGEANGNPLQYSCLGNPMDRGA